MIKNNEMFIVSIGEYSQVQALLQARVDITKEMVDDRPKGTSLQGWLVEMDLARIVDCGEVWEEGRGSRYAEIRDRM